MTLPILSLYSHGHAKKMRFTPPPTNNYGYHRGKRDAMPISEFLAQYRYICGVTKECNHGMMHHVG